MKLYSLDYSPYSTRIRAQIRHKKLPISCVNPSQLKSAQLNNMFPLGQLPVLCLDDGELLAESTVIMNYLEEIFPQHSLRGESAVEKARANMMVRWSDTHLGPLVRDVLCSDRAALIGTAEIPVIAELGKIDSLIAGQSDYHQREIHIGDFCAVISITFTQALFELCASTSLLGKFPRLLAWWQFSLQRNLALNESVVEMVDAIKEWLPISGCRRSYLDGGLLANLCVNQEAS
jgi:glutathione S-transferase